MTEFRELPERDILTPDDVAGYLMLSADMVRRMCKDGRIGGAINCGRAWRIVRQRFLEGLSGFDHSDLVRKDFAIVDRTLSELREEEACIASRRRGEQRS